MSPLHKAWRLLDTGDRHFVITIAIGLALLAVLFIVGAMRSHG